MGERVGWRAWVAAAVGPSAEVVRIERRHGGITSLVHAVDVVERDGRRTPLILRRYPSGDAAGLVGAEVRALGALAVADVPMTPRLVRADPTGAAVGHPAVLTTRLPGRPDLAPRGAAAWAAGLAGALLQDREALGRLDVAHLPRFRWWWPGAAPPGRWADPLRAATEHVAREPVALEAIHRDLNPGNVLWHRGRVSGIVDWVHLCAGPVEQDVARCRVNAWLLAGRPAAVAFDDELRRSSLAVAPVWDLAVLAELLPHLDGLLEANRLGARLTRSLLDHRVAEIVRQWVPPSTA